MRHEIEQQVQHPACLDVDVFTKHCRFEFNRRQGPGGQHRNKVETAVIATYVPTGHKAESNGERSQGVNRTIAIFRLRLKMAIDVRVADLHALESAKSVSETTLSGISAPTELWLSRLRGTRLQISPIHDDFPAILAESLEHIYAFQGDLGKASKTLRTTSSQLLKLLKNETLAWKLVNQWRETNNLRPLR